MLGKMKTMSDYELRILGAIRAIGSRDHRQEERKRALTETVLTLTSVAVLGLIEHWSMT